MVDGRRRHDWDLMSTLIADVLTALGSEIHPAEIHPMRFDELPSIEELGPPPGVHP